jgi:exopolysaccharide production protein ExoQ
MLTASFLFAGAAFKTGILNFVIVDVLGKASDLSGRADFWQIALANFDGSGRSLLGGGLGSGFALDLSEWSIDNGYIDMLIDFGYLIVPVLFGLYVIILWKGVKLLLASSREIAATNVFPFGILTVILIANITESNFMSKCYGTILTAVAVGLLFEERNLRAKESAEQVGASDAWPLSITR